MADDFDPYYTWLGIPPEEQPATHYRLLGVRPFEPSLDVISNAADQRMAFLRTFQVGKRSALSQRLLNEMAAAKGCLLDPNRRNAYDAKLRASQPVSAPHMTPQPFSAASVEIPPATVPSRPMTVARPLPVAAPHPALTPEPLAPIDPFADVARELVSQRALPAKPQAQGSGDFSDQAMGWIRAIVSRAQESPLATAAYGALALGVVMLLSVVTWIVFRNGNESATSVAATPPVVVGETKLPDIGKTSNQESTTPIPARLPNSSAKSPEPGTPSEEPLSTESGQAPTVGTNTQETTLTPSSPAAATVPSSTAPTPTANTVPRTSVDYSPLIQVLKGPFFSPGLRTKLSPSGKFLAVWQNMESSIQVFNLSEPTAPLELKEPSGFGLTCACFEFDEKLACGGNRSIVIWDVKKGRLLWQSSESRAVRDMAFWNFGTQLAVACEGKDPLRLLWPGRGTDKSLTGSPKSPLQISVGNDWLAALWEGGQVQIFNLKYGRIHKTLTHPDRKPYERVFVVRDYVITVDASGYQLWDAKEGKREINWTSRLAPSMTSLAFAPTGMFAMQEGEKLKLIRFPEDSLAATITWPGEKFGQVEFSNTLQRLVTSGPDHTLLVWDVGALGKLQTCSMYSPAQLAEFSPVAPMLAAVSGVSPGGKSEPSSSTPTKNSNGPAPATTVPGLAGGMTPAQALERLRTLGIKDLAQRPEDVSYVNVHNVKFTDSDAQCLASLPQLENLYFSDVPVTGKTLQALQNCPRLKVLSLHKADIGDDELASLGSVKTLMQLNLYETRATAKCLEHLAALSSLESLSLPQGVGREMVPYLAKFPKLRYLSPFPPNVTDDDMKVIGQLRSLESLDLQQAKLTTAGYKELANMTEVKSATISNLAPAGVMVYFTKMKLNYLGFPDSSTEKELELFQKMGTVRFLRPPMDTSDEGLRVIAGFSGLEDINLVSVRNITDAGMAHLAKNSTLKRVMLPSRIGDEGLSNLSRSRSLVDINMDRSAMVTEKGLQSLVSMTGLERVCLPSTVDDSALKLLARCPNLKSVLFYECNVSEEGLKSLQKFRQLEEINLISVKLTTPGIEVIKSLTNLKLVMLQRCSVSSEDAATLKAALPKARVSISQ